MKNLIYLIPILIFLTFSSYAQQLEIQAYAQETIVGLQKGYSIKMVNNQGVKLGMFYQSTQNFSFNEGINNYPFMGTELSYPMTQCGKVRLHANLKGGVVNYRFLVLIPELETTYNLKDYLDLGVGTSIRGGHAAISFKVMIKPFANRKFN